MHFLLIPLLFMIMWQVWKIANREEKGVDVRIVIKKKDMDAIPYIPNKSKEEFNDEEFLKTLKLRLDK